MSLFRIPDMHRYTSVPHDRDNRPLINRIPPNQLHEIFDELNRRIDAVVDSPEELITAGWIPGYDWTGTVWEPIYFACNRDYGRSAMVFGALVFETINESG